MRSQTLYTSIASGASLSGVVGVKGAEAVGLLIPTITSAQVCLSVSQSSEDSFMRVFKTDGSSHFVINAGPGSMGIHVGDVLKSFTHAKVETLVAQADTRSFTIIVKF